MGAWTFAKGKGAERTVMDVVTAGSIQATAGAAWATFAAGDLLFISEADGSEAEYLGRVISSEGNTVAFTLPVRTSKNSDGVIWKPSAHLSVAADVDFPVYRRSHSGVTIYKSLSGGVFAIRTGVAEEILELHLKELTPASDRAVREWLDANSAGGLEAFTIIGPDRCMDAVRMLPDGRGGRTDAGGRHTVIMRARIESPEGYA